MTDEKAKLVAAIGKLTIGTLVTLILGGVLYTNWLDRQDRRAYDQQVQGLLKEQIVLLVEIRDNQKLHTVFHNIAAD